MQSPNHSDIDWTGVRPDQSEIGRLDDNSFVVRLRLLSERARSLTILRNAFMPPLNNAMLVEAADSIFLKLDKEESRHG